MDHALGVTGAEVDELATLQKYRQFEQDFVAALEQLIEADAAATSDARAAARYTAYVQALTPTLSLASGDAWSGQIQAALKSAGRQISAVGGRRRQLPASHGRFAARRRWAAARHARVTRAEPTEAEFRGILDKLPATMLSSFSAKLLGKPGVGRDLIGTPATQCATSGLSKKNTYCVVPLDPRLHAAAARSARRRSARTPASR